jgi:hypothetical protein
VTTPAERLRAHALVNDLLGPSDDAADRAVAVLNAHAAALAWVRETTGSYPAPPIVANRLERAAQLLRSGHDAREPGVVLSRTAKDALAVHRATSPA